MPSFFLLHRVFKHLKRPLSDVGAQYKNRFHITGSAGGVTYWLMLKVDVNVGLASFVTFLLICTIRFLAMRYHISLPQLHAEE